MTVKCKRLQISTKQKQATNALSGCSSQVQMDAQKEEGLRFVEGGGDQGAFHARGDIELETS